MLVQNRKHEMQKDALKAHCLLLQEKGSLMHRAQDRAPVARSKSREKLYPEAKPPGFSIRGRFSSFPHKPSCTVFPLFVFSLAWRLLLRKVMWVWPSLVAETTLGSKLGHISMGGVNPTNQSPLHTQGFLSSFHLVCIHLSVNPGLSVLQTITGAEAGSGG